MTVWQCAGCQTVNDADAQNCVVCRGTSRLTEASVRAPEPEVAAGRAHLSAPVVMSPGAGHARARPPTWYPPPLVPRPVPSRARPVRTICVVLAVLLGASGLGLVAVRYFHSADAAPEPPATTDPPVRASTTSAITPATRTVTDQPEPEVSQVGIVAISVPSAVAERVARMFDSYFSAVNSGDHDTVLGLYDPAGVLDTTDPAKAQQFLDDISTTKDDGVVLKDVTDNGSTITADVTFRSRQAAGKGPRADPEQTCTVWSLRYVLTDNGQQLLIRKGTGSYTSC